MFPCSGLFKAGFTDRSSETQTTCSVSGKAAELRVEEAEEVEECCVLKSPLV